MRGPKVESGNMNPARSMRKRADKNVLPAPAAVTAAKQSISQPTSPRLRVGTGNDLHRLADGRKLIVGGVKIPFEKGPVGHSDGDVLAHAICDALLGAAHLGDIGRHFPNTSPRWKDASSLLFLRHVRQLLDAAGYSIVNIDATVGLERPKIGSAS